jgi:hypothetical protein
MKYLCRTGQWSAELETGSAAEAARETADQACCEIGAIIITELVDAGDYQLPAEIWRTRTWRVRRAIEAVA